MPQLCRKPMPSLRFFYPALLVCVFSSNFLWGSTIRLASLGGENDLLRDSSNIYLYPALAHELPHFGVALFDNWAGAVYPLGQRHALGLFFNRPTPQQNRLNAYISKNGSAIFNSLQVHPLADVLYGLKLGKNLQLGLLARLAYAKRERDSTDAAASSADLRLGLRLGNLNATIGFLRRNLKDMDHSTEGVASLPDKDTNGYLLNLRLRMKLTPQLHFYPSAGFEKSSYSLGANRQDEKTQHLGFSFNVRPANQTLIIAGLLASYQQTEIGATDASPALNESILVLPTTILAGETQVGSILFRLGLRHENILTSVEQFQDHRLVAKDDFTTAFKTNLGVGLEFGSLLLDGLLERDFLRDGPHLIGGSRHGGGIFSKISITFHF